MMAEDLKIIKQRPYAFVYPATPEMLNCFISGLVRGFLLSSSWTYEDYRSASKYVISLHGWRIRPTSPYEEMREKNLSDEQIIQELLDIEIETWNILEEDL